MTTLRPYQIDALRAIDDSLKTEPIVLLKAITGAGKTIILCRLVNRYFHETNRSFLILAHKQEIIEQILNTFVRHTDIPSSDVCVCCAAMGSKQIHKRVTIGTIQTFAGVIDSYTGCDLLIVDEAHRITIGNNSQYDKVIKTLKTRKPHLRILGCTSTPSRLSHGYCYGTRCRPGARNLFPRINHEIKYRELRDGGYLMPLTGMVAHADGLNADLAGVAINGDYVLDRLGEIMSREIHLQTAVQAIADHCEGFKRICIFCCTIDHAERLSALLPGSTTVHSRLGAIERASNMIRWTTGECRIITSVNILAEGFDHPPLDCLVFARPTLSSTLFLQAVGRVLRTSPGKDKAFLLDLTDNTSRFGTDLDNVKVTVPKGVEAQMVKEGAMNKICPMCDTTCHVALRECPECAFLWPEQECVVAEELPELSAVAFEPTPPEWRDVHNMDVMEHQSKGNGKMLIRVSLDISTNNYRPETVSLWMCLPDAYGGYAVQKSRDLWQIIGIGDMPESVPEAITRVSDFIAPTRVLLDRNGEYPEVKDFECLVPF